MIPLRHSLQGIGWRQEALYALNMAMEAAWLAPLVLIVSPRPAPGTLSAWGLLLFYAVAFWCGRLVLGLRVDAPRSRLLILYLVGASILVSLKLAHYGNYSWLSLNWLGRLFADLVLTPKNMSGPVLTILAGVYLWWRGLRLGNRPVTLRLAGLRFQVGAVALVAAAGLAPSLALGDLSGSVFAFFACGLLAVSLARLEDMTGGKASVLDRYWLGVLLGATGLVLLVGGLSVSAVFSSVNVVTWLLERLQVVWDLLASLLILVLLPLGMLVDALVNLLRPLFAGGRPMKAPETDDSVQTMLRELQRTQSGLPAEWQQVLRAAALILLLVLAARLLTRVLGRKADEGGEDEEVRESLGLGGNLWGDLRSALAGLWNRLARPLRRQAEALRAAVRGDDSGSALSIRQVYAALLHRGAFLGFPRRLDQTPFEYLEVLNKGLPAQAGELAQITEAYVGVRYSQAPAAPGVLQAVRQAWQRIRQGAV